MSLYKYTSFEVGLKILLESKIRFTQPNAFNDPFDTYPCLDEIYNDQQLLNCVKIFFNDYENLIEKEFIATAKVHYDILPIELRENIPFEVFLRISRKKVFGEIDSYYTFFLKNRNIHDIRRSTIDEFLYTIWNNVGILSLSQTNDNLLMWSHYADSHKGIIIEFDETHPFFTTVNEEEGLPCNKVTYVSSRPSLKIEETEINDIAKNIRNTFYVKSEIWAYEKEYRTIRFIRNSLPVTEAYNEFNIHLFDLPKNIIKGIILGCRVDKESREKMFNALQKKGMLDKIYTNQAKVDTKNYKVIICSE